MRSGEWVLAHRALPRTDPYSFSKAGEPWLEWEWGSDVLVGLAHRMDGLRGVMALFALEISACSWMWCRLHFAVGGEFLLVPAFAPLMITTASLHWLARPHIFSWLFLLGSLLYAERRAQDAVRDNETRRGVPELAAIAAVTAVWANLHASFFLAPVIALIYAASHLARPLLWRLDQGAERRKALWFLWAALAAFGGSLLNPYGWRVHAHIFSYLRDNELTSRIAEFQSFNFHDKDATQVALTVALAALGGTLALGQKKLAHFLLAAMFVWEALVFGAGAAAGGSLDSPAGERSIRRGVAPCARVAAAAEARGRSRSWLLLPPTADGLPAQRSVVPGWGCLRFHAGVAGAGVLAHDPAFRPNVSRSKRPRPWSSFPPRRGSSRPTASAAISSIASTARAKCSWMAAAIFTAPAS